MLNFVNSCPISYLTVVVDRREAADKVSLSGKLAKAINTAMSAHQDFFSSFGTIIVYYDNGQNELSAILNAVFSIQFSNVEFRKAEPQKYRLLQAADFICSMELLKIKKNEKRLSRSEEQFFYKSQELKKTFFRSIEKKKGIQNKNEQFQQRNPPHHWRYRQLRTHRPEAFLTHRHRRNPHLLPRRKKAG